MPFCYQTRFTQWFSLRVCDWEEKSWDRKKNEDKCGRGEREWCFWGTSKIVGEIVVDK